MFLCTKLKTSTSSDGTRMCGKNVRYQFGLFFKPGIKLIWPKIVRRSILGHKYQQSKRANNNMVMKMGFLLNNLPVNETKMALSPPESDQFERYEPH